jgi:ribosomal protein S18 acetylase RimI-like enzyme
VTKPVSRWDKVKLSHNNSPEISVREFRIDDYDTLVALWNEAELPHRPKGRDRLDKIERELERGNAVYLVAELDGRLIGSVLGTHDCRKGWINRLAVAPEFQHQGVARKLVTEVEKRFYELGIEMVACLVYDSNARSMELFEKLGYKRESNIVYFTKRGNLDV